MALPTTLKSLTPQQRRYVDARITGMPSTQAAVAAGGSAKSASSYEKHPGVQQAIREITEKAMAKLVLSREDVLRGLMDAVNAAATSTELVAAWREIGKIIGAYEPQKIAITHEMLLPEQMRAMSDKQLMAAAAMDGLTIDSRDYSVAVPDGET